MTAPPTTTWLPLDAYGAIGDMQTLALSSRTGSIDWWCWPRFDAPSVFGRLLDADGGHWQIEPVDEPTAVRHLYLPGTNVLLTRFHSDESVVEVEDYLVIGGPRRLARRVTCQRGTTTMRVVIAPRPDYGRAEVDLTAEDGAWRLDVGHGERLWFGADVELGLEPDGSRLVAEFEIGEGETVAFVAGESPDLDDDCGYRRTVDFWREWIGRSTYRGRWREAVERSALALKLLTHDESGGLLAAGTTSLPEAVGGERNYDYRYVWIRDAAFTLYALLELGFRDEADAFTAWLLARLDGDAAAPAFGPLAPLYDLDGSAELDERTLDHWSGYRGSAPVRVGNAASDQFQLDIYGELV
ncbi:MAG: glycoside hydrolase family 15 protein, partial [Acidimicrobiales bacterium]